MKTIQTFFVRTFRHPRGVLGRFGGSIMARANRRMAKRAIALLDVQPAERVLEIGFGPGIGIRLLARSTPARCVAGIDASAGMVEQARARNAKHMATGRVALLRGSVERLPFESAAFDKALAIRCMQTWAEPLAGLQEIRRVLQPGGGIVLGFARQSGPTTKTLTQLLHAAGFTDPRVVDVKGERYALAGSCCRRP